MFIEELTVCTRYLSVHTPERANARGILLCLGEALKLMSIDNVLDKECVLGVGDKPVCVSWSWRFSEFNGLRGQMQQALPFLFWSWCYAHRLELACRDAFISSLFSLINEMLLRLYYIYESPNVSLVDDLSLPKGGHLPVRSHGTRWITHKRKALQRVLDRYGMYVHNSYQCSY